MNQRMMEVVVNWTTGAISRAKLQSNHHHQQTNIQFLQAGCPSCHPTNSVKALKGKYHIPWTCLPQAHLGGLPTLSLTTNSSWLPWGRVAMPRISLLMPVPQSRIRVIKRICYCLFLDFHGTFLHCFLGQKLTLLLLLILLLLQRS